MPYGLAGGRKRHEYFVGQHLQDACPSMALMSRRSRKAPHGDAHRRKKPHALMVRFLGLEATFQNRMSSRSCSSNRMARRAGVPGFMPDLLLSIQPVSGEKPVMQKNLQQDSVPRISRTAQLIRPNLRDTLRWALQLRIFVPPASQFELEMK